MPKLFLPALALLLCLPRLSLAQQAPTFAPVSPPKELRALPATGPITVDGRLDEPDWLRAEPAQGFFQIQPDQGLPLQTDPQVRVLFDDKNLYLGAYSPDSLGRAGIRVPDLRRDFDFFTNDLFGLSLDPFRDRRNSQSFMTNPYGAQRDLLAVDDTFFDREWDALWRVRTSRTDSGWVAELAIPWKTLRYPADSAAWGVNFVRIARRLNEVSSWNPYPQATSHQRMEYAGLLLGLRPPPPSVNLRVQPYLLTTYDRRRSNGRTEAAAFQPKAGGEVKWALNPFTVLDLTLNTDFAQADVDRQVQNLTRFSVFFPERRQFFLENANLFLVGQAGAVQPFFSRRIGLAPDGTPLPVDGGARLVSRTPTRGLGALLMRQREAEGLPAAYFGVARYSQNIGKQNRLGALVTARHDQAPEPQAAPATNLTYTFDGFFRPVQPLTWSFMLSGSSGSGPAANGFAATSNLLYSSNQWTLWYNQSLISRGYDPQVGFIYASDLANANFGGYRIMRPPWRPKALRQLDPGFEANVFHRISDRSLQQAQVEFFPLYLIFVKGALFNFFVAPTWQRLDAPFRPLGVTIPAGDYRYLRYRAYYGNDQSRKFSYRARFETGGYFDGRLQTWLGSVRYSPIPHVSVLFSYERNGLRGVGGTDLTAHLITPEARLALNPRLQLIGFYQHNSAADRDVWNLRLAWEFQPLSFLYLVYNSNTAHTPLERLQQEQVIGKITFLKQF